jgi:hypothetical protein
METAPLKSFATWARTALIREVAARIAVVAAPASPERVERPSAVAALEKAVKAAGGGVDGRAAVADKVAYTWFNRIIALRFMDANGYTGTGVVSPERSREGGQPEVLAEAKRGDIDATVITNKRTVETVTSLLNGTQRSDDPQGEAYALLLTEYCRYWNRSMPFMFEREGDYTELLIPANLLADDSVLARAVTVLTEKVCQDVEVIGWLYQFYIAERKDDVFAGFKKGKKAGATEIPAATQLFTPHWIVRYLVENSLGRLWLLNRPSSCLAKQMEYYIAPIDQETNFLKVSSPEELKIIDPACGSGHMLTYAFELLYTIYEEEGYAPSDIPGLILAKNLYGTEIDPRAGALAAFALAMKARARQRTFFSQQVRPNICAFERISFTPDELDQLRNPDGDRAAEEEFWNQFEHADTLGSLIQPREELIEPLQCNLDAHEPDTYDLITGNLFERARRVILQAQYLSPRYHVVVANPPYMGTGNMDAQLSDFIRSEYPRSRSDLFASFIERNIRLSVSSGRVAMITMQSWMFLNSYKMLRAWLATAHSIEGMAHLGTRAFGTISGEVVGTTAFTIHVDVGGERGAYLRLVEASSESKKRDTLAELCSTGTHRLKFVLSSADFKMIPGGVLVYWLPEPMRLAFQGLSLGSRFSSPGRTKTHNNARYLRQWWEVRYPSRRWRTLTNGGGPLPFYGHLDQVVDWSNEALVVYEAHGGRQDPAGIDAPGITWSMVSGAGRGFRFRPPGLPNSSGSPTLISLDEATVFAALAALNTKLVDEFLNALNPTVNTEYADVAALPLKLLTNSDRLAEIGEEAYRNARALDATFETSPEFRKLVPEQQLGAMGVAQAVDNLIELRKRLQESLTVARTQANDITMANLRLSEDGSVLRDSPTDGYDVQKSTVVRELLSYAVGCMFGRYSLDQPGLILASHGNTLQDYLAKVPSPSFTPDKDNVIPIVDGDWFEDDIVARFRQFLRVGFGEQHFEENLRFVAESLGVKDLRDYFVKSFYKEHVQRYKKRPIYWLFSSPNGSFNALIYIHRYMPSTASTVLNEYLREFRAKLDASRQHHESITAGTGTPREKAIAQKEVDRLRKVLLELDEYEHDVLYPLATQQVQIDLDDGVKANYPKFGAALKKIPGLEASDG